MPLELSKVRPAETFEAPLYDPLDDDPPKGQKRKPAAFAILHGPFSKPGRSAIETAGALRTTGASEQAVNTETIVLMTVGFRELTLNGEPVGESIDTESVRAIFDEFPWMLDQIDNAWVEKRRFFKQPSPPSSPTRRTKRNSAK